MLDYSFPYQFTLTVGGLDLTSCVKSIVWGLSPHEPEAPLVYTGQLQLALSVQAQIAGVTNSDMDPQQSPNRWEAGMAQVVLAVPELNVSLKFRLSDWRWNSKLGTGEGKLTQQIELYNRPFPDLEPEVVYTAPAGGTQTVQVMAQSLLAAAASKVSPAAAMLVGSISMGATSEDKVWGTRATRNPLSEVQAYAKTGWAWLTQSLTTELAEVKPLRYDTAPQLFSRRLLDVDSSPNLDSISFAAPKVIAHGSCDVPDECQGDNNANANDKGNPKIQVTQSLEPAGKIFPKLSPNETQYPAQRKTVRYYYLTDTVLVSPEFYPKPYPPIALDSSSGLYRVETTIEEPRGKIFPKLAPDLALEVSSRTVEVAQWKAQWKCRGLVFPKEAPSFTPQLDVVETLQTEYIPKGGAKSGRLANGAHGCVDKAEPEQTRVVEVKLRTQDYRGEATVTRNYTPALDYPFVYSIGYCTSQASADLNAACVAIREQARRYADDVELPLAPEWLVAGCPHYAKAQIGTKVLYIDAPAAEISVDDEGRLSGRMRFTGLHLASTTSEPLANEALAYDPYTSLAQGPLSSLSTTVHATQGEFFTLKI